MYSEYSKLIRYINDEYPEAFKNDPVLAIFLKTIEDTDKYEIELGSKHKNGECNPYGISIIYNEKKNLQNIFKKSVSFLYISSSNEIKAAGSF